MGVERSTFVIDEDGNLAKIMRNVKPAEHADDVLSALRRDLICEPGQGGTWHVQARRSCFNQAKGGRSTWAGSE